MCLNFVFLTFFIFCCCLKLLEYFNCFLRNTCTYYLKNDIFWTIITGPLLDFQRIKKKYFGAVVSITTERRKPSTTSATYSRRYCHCLHISHSSWASEQTNISGKWWFQTWFTLFTFQ